MATDVVMPQMGESVAEGTVVRWIKHVGDPVERDEPLFEISTDKVDAEIPSPGAGVLLEIRVAEGETVPVDTVVAVIGPEGSQVSETASASPASVREPEPERVSGSSGAPAQAPSEGARPEALTDERRRRKSSPLVRRIAEEHGVEVSNVTGTGVSGRVTKRDILAHLDAGKPPAEPGTAGQEGPVSFEPMSVMRRKIAEHMVQSQRTAAHVYSVFEIDFSRVDEVRQKRKADYAERGAKLTFLSFIAKATVEALLAMPVINAAIEGEKIAYRKDVNLGIAVALDWGLIVPVIHRAQEKNLLGLSRAIADVAARARGKQLKPEEVKGGTFTITNPGSLGTMMGMPIINQPQSAILAVGSIDRRVVAVDEAIAIRPRAFLTLGYDHRLIDGAVADQFVGRIKQSLEEFDPSAA